MTPLFCKKTTFAGGGAQILGKIGRGRDGHNRLITIVGWLITP
jgi:hypothetical protein